jgi:hypothetical protein
VAGVPGVGSSAGSMCATITASAPEVNPFRNGGNSTLSIRSRG